MRGDVKWRYAAACCDAAFGELLASALARQQAEGGAWHERKKDDQRFIDMGSATMWVLARPIASIAIIHRLRIGDR